MQPVKFLNSCPFLHVFPVNTGLIFHLEGLAAHDALEAAQVVDVGHGAHHQVVRG